jgi:hypothetical protein
MDKKLWQSDCAFVISLSQYSKQKDKGQTMQPFESCFENPKTLAAAIIDQAETMTRLFDLLPQVKEQGKEILSTCAQNSDIARNG